MNTKAKIILMNVLLLVLLFLLYFTFDSKSFHFLSLPTAIIVLISVIASFYIRALKIREKERKEGQAEEDEFSEMIKYKAGFYAFNISMYIWMFIFFFKRYFPDVETMLGGGILASVLAFFIMKYKVKKSLNEE